MEDIEKIISRNVRQRREEKGLTQEELAEKSSLSQTGIQQIEGGKRIPRPKTWVKIASALDWQVYQLFMPDPYAIEPKPAPVPPTIAELARELTTALSEVDKLRAQLSLKTGVSQDLLDVLLDASSDAILAKTLKGVYSAHRKKWPRPAKPESSED